ncbi:MAG TPA: cohesin domain-containing protein [Ruminococcus sp.]|nr:cohesin domain-containing protein [Ruminococcus sp.]
MKKLSSRFVSAVISLAAGLMCVTAPAVNAVEPTVTESTVKQASRMQWEVDNAQTNAGSDVQVEIKVSNSVALKSISGLVLTVEGNITPKSVVSNAGGSVEYSVSGNKISFSLVGLNKVANGGTVLTATYHVNDGCEPGYYKVDWTNDGLLGAYGYLSDGSIYYPTFEYGYIRVLNGGTAATTTTQPVVTTTTTKKAATTTTTTKKATTTTTTTTTAKLTTTTMPQTTTTTGADEVLKKAVVSAKILSNPTKLTYPVGTERHEILANGFSYHIKIDAEYKSGKKAVYEEDLTGRLNYLSCPKSDNPAEEFPPLLCRDELDYSEIDITKPGHYPVYLRIYFADQSLGEYRDVAFYVDYVADATTTTTAATTTTTTTTTKTEGGYPEDAVITFDFGTHEAKPGDKITVDVAISAGQNKVISMDANFAQDSPIKLIDISETSQAFDRAAIQKNLNIPACNFPCLDDDGNGITADESKPVFTLTYEVPLNCPSGEYKIGFGEKCEVYYDNTAWIYKTEQKGGTIKVTAPEQEDYALGDVNNDGSVDGSDATWVLREFGNVLAGKGESFTPDQFKAGDVDLSGVIDGSDATLILKFFGEAGKDINVSYGGMQKWMDENFWKKDEK